MFPAVINERIAAAISDQMRPPPGLEFDFSRPLGEAALVPADSISWRIFRNPVSLFIGGIAAVILELAEPSVRTGVWEHSSFRRDAVMRLRRTGAAAMMTVYGPRSSAEQMIAHVVRMHARVSGETPDGTPYQANDQRLLDWVQATASFGFIEAYNRYVAPLSEAERSQAFGEGAAAARLYGALGAPTSLDGWNAMLAEMEPQLERSEIVFEFLDTLREAPIGPAASRPIQRLLIRAAVDMTPLSVRQKLGLEEQGLSAWQRPLVGLMGRVADKVPLPNSPAVQASARMGLPASHTYR